MSQDTLIYLSYIDYKAKMRSMGIEHVAFSFIKYRYECLEMGIFAKDAK